jgi:transcriptional regulator with XRE-family HTH domain
MNRISAIVNGKRAITVDTAMRLARYFGTSPQYWLNLQVAYDLEVAGQEIQPQIEKEVLPRTAAWNPQVISGLAPAAGYRRNTSVTSASAPCEACIPRSSFFDRNRLATQNPTNR